VKEHPILFSGEMVRAILDGRKTQTRRLVRLPPGYEHGEVYGYEGSYNGRHCLACDPGPSRAILCPFGVPGDRLWVRETWRDGQYAVGKEWDFDDRVGYRASFVGDPALKWKPSIHMPRWASRLTLEVVSVRVERLQDITEADAQAEGVDSGAPWFPPGQWSPPDEDPRQVGYGRGNFALQNFRALWEHINGKRAPWASNPWVWVVTFKTL